MLQDYTFTRVNATKEKYDTCCWGFTAPKSEPTQLYFILPPLLDREIRIKVLYTSLCHTDYHKAEEAWGPNMVYPYVPGHEIVGQVEKLGPKCKKFAIGDIVAVGPFRDCCGGCKFCRSGADNLCQNAPYKSVFDPYLGGFSTRMNINEDFAFELPLGLNPAWSAPLLCAGLTVFSPLLRWCEFGVKCGVVGIGGLGHLAVQMAHKMGMDVTAISTCPDKELDCIAFGAKNFVCTSKEGALESLKSQLDIVINTGYMHDLSKYVMTVRPGGTFINVGLAEVNKPTTFDMIDVVCGQKNFVGSLAGSKKDVKDMLQFCVKHGIQPKTEMFAWNEFPKAYKKLADVKSRYRSVIDVEKTFQG